MTIKYPEYMRIFSSQSIQTLNADDRKIVWDLVNGMMAIQQTMTRPEPFYFEYRNITMMFAPESDFLFEIPDMPLPSIGGDVPGAMILAAYPAVNDRLPSHMEESLL